MRWAVAMPALGTRRQHLWRYLGLMGGGGWLTALPWFKRLWASSLYSAAKKHGRGNGERKGQSPKSANLGEERSLRPFKCSMLDRTEETSWPWCKALGIRGDGQGYCQGSSYSWDSASPSTFLTGSSGRVRSCLAAPTGALNQPTPVFILETRHGVCGFKGCTQGIWASVPRGMDV